MYRVIQLDDFEGHELKLSSNSDQFRVFALHLRGIRRGAAPPVSA